MRQIRMEKRITAKEEESLNQYLVEIGREELIDANKEVILAKRIKQGDQEALEKLVKANLRFVVFVAKSYQNLGLLLPDLISEGNLGLMKAAERFDETRGFKFITYAVWWVRQSIMQALTEQGSTIRLPLNQIGALWKINKAFSELEQKYEREPSPEELAEMLEFNSKMVIDVRSRSQRAVSLTSSINREDGEKSTMLDVIEDPYAEKPDQALMNDSSKKEVEDKLSALDDREREILCLFFGINQNHPLMLEEIGEIFDLTRERVRQIKERAIRRLRNRAKFLQNGTHKTHKHSRENSENSDRKVVEVLPAKHASNGYLNTKKAYYVGIASLIRGDVARVKKAINQLIDSDYGFLANELDTALKTKRFNKQARKLFLKNRPDVAKEVALFLKDRANGVDKKIAKSSKKPQKVIQDC